MRLTFKRVVQSRWVLAAWLYLYIAYLSVLRVDPDYGWHYRSGEYIVHHGVPMHDIFTYTARNFAWINHEWLNDVIMYNVAHFAGYVVLGLLFAAVWTSAVWMAVGKRRLSWTVAGLALGALMPYLGSRPVAWTALGLGILLVIFERPRLFPWLPVLFVAWANLHAGFALGLVFVALRALTCKSKRLAGWGLVSLAATLINPYGLRIYIELWRTMSDTHLGSRIVEWAPLSVNQAVMPYTVAAIVVLLMLSGFTFERIIGGILVVAAIWQNRQMPLLVVGTIGVVNKAVTDVCRYLRQPRWWGVLGGVVGVVYPVSLLVWPPSGGVSLVVPTAAFVQLKAQPCSGHVFNDYNYGGDMIYALPGVPDYIDGRMPSWVGPDGSYLSTYVQVLKGGATTTQQFRKYDITCALISDDDKSLAGYLVRQTGWYISLKGYDYALWRKK